MNNDQYHQMNQELNTYQKRYSKGSTTMANPYPTQDTSKRIRLGYVRIAEMMRIPGGNRSVTESQVVKLMRIWNDDSVGVFTLSLRSDGAYYILNGQHRHEALLRAGRGRESFPAEIHEGLSLREELQVCKELNANQKSWTAVDFFKMDKELGRPEAIELEGIVNKYGLELNLIDGRREGGKLSAIGALRKIYSQYQPGTLDDVLMILTKSFGTQEGFTGEVMLGITSFLAIYRDDPNYSHSELIRSLSTATPSRIEAEGKEARKLLGLRASEGVAYQALRAYNHRKKSRRLPEWGEVSRRGSR